MSKKTNITNDVDELQQFFDEQGMKIKIVIYRQGAPKPELEEF